VIATKGEVMSKRLILVVRRRRFALTAAGVLTVAALVGGVAYATIPNSEKVFTACMLKNVGTIRLIDPSLPPSSPMQHCTSLEAQVSWNQQGQPGSAGPPGPQGPTGPKGDKGEPGRGINSLEDLAGAPCRTPDFQGVVEISSTPLSARSASISLRCTIPNVAILTVHLTDPHDPNAGGGRVTGGPVDCELVAGTGNQTCVYIVPLGLQLTLTATPLSPNPEWESFFIQWGAIECVTPAPCTFTVTGDRTIVAEFSARQVSP
jgi:hypothetical protein